MGALMPTADTQYTYAVEVLAGGAVADLKKYEAAVASAESRTVEAAAQTAAAVQASAAAQASAASAAAQTAQAAAAVQAAAAAQTAAAAQASAAVQAAAEGRQEAAIAAAWNRRIAAERHGQDTVRSLIARGDRSRELKLQLDRELSLLHEAQKTSTITIEQAQQAQNAIVKRYTDERARIQASPGPVTAQGAAAGPMFSDLRTPSRYASAIGGVRSAMVQLGVSATSTGGHLGAVAQSMMMLGGKAGMLGLAVAGAASAFAYLVAEAAKAKALERQAAAMSTLWGVTREEIKSVATAYRGLGVDLDRKAVQSLVAAGKQAGLSTDEMILLGREIKNTADATGNEFAPEAVSAFGKFKRGAEEAIASLAKLRVSLREALSGASPGELASKAASRAIEDKIAENDAARRSTIAKLEAGVNAPEMRGLAMQRRLDLLASAEKDGEALLAVRERLETELAKVRDDAADVAESEQAKRDEDEIAAFIKNENAKTDAAAAGGKKLAEERVRGAKLLADAEREVLKAGLDALVAGEAQYQRTWIELTGRGESKILALKAKTAAEGAAAEKAYAAKRIELTDESESKILALRADAALTDEQQEQAVVATRMALARRLTTLEAEEEQRRLKAARGFAEERRKLTLESAAAVADAIGAKADALNAKNAKTAALFPTDGLDGFLTGIGYAQADVDAFKSSLLDMGVAGGVALGALSGAMDGLALAASAAKELAISSLRDWMLESEAAGELERSQIANRLIANNQDIADIDDKLRHLGAGAEREREIAKRQVLVRKELSNAAKIEAADQKHAQDERTRAILASLAIEAGVQALYHAAMALGTLATPPIAAGHAAAAVMLAAVAGTAGVKAASMGGGPATGSQALALKESYAQRAAPEYEADRESRRSAAMSRSEASEGYSKRVIINVFGNPAVTEAHVGELIHQALEAYERQQ